MVIKASAGREIDELIGDLSSRTEATREGAVARLSVIGARAVERLIGLAGNGASDSGARVCALRSLERIADPRGLEPALKAFTDPDEVVAVAALNVARVFLRTPHGVRALGRVTATALDRQRPAPVRLAALHALAELSPAAVKPVRSALKTDPDPDIAHALDPGADQGFAEAPAERVLAAAEGTLKEDPAALRRAIAGSPAEVPDAVLRQVIDHVRVREGAEPASSRPDWMAVRGAAHAALALRGSRIALYDLRETMEAARQGVPVEFLAALAAIGDASCLEAIAAAYARAGEVQPPDDWWRRHLADAFRIIAGREKITRRHALVKRIERRWKAALDDLWAGRAG